MQISQEVSLEVYHVNDRWECDVFMLADTTYLLTPWCRVLLEKLTGLQLVKKFPAFLWNPKVHYHTHKRPPPVPVLAQPNPVHIPTSHLLEIHPNIIHPSTPRSSQWYIYILLIYIYINNNLSWKIHIESIKNKLSPACYVVRLVKPHVTANALKVIYYSCFHSVMT